MSRDLFNLIIDAVVFGIIFKLLSAFHFGVSLTGGVLSGVFVGIVYVVVIEVLSFLRELLFVKMLSASGQGAILLFFARMRFNSLVVAVLTLLSLLVTASVLPSFALTGFFGTLFVAFVLYVSRIGVERVWLRTGYQWLYKLARRLQQMNDKDKGNR